jgi:hypothetical protein
LPIADATQEETGGMNMQRLEAQMERFEHSFSALARLAMQEADAAGYAFFTKRPESSTLVRQAAGGVPVPEGALNGANPLVAAYPLRTDGIIDGVLAFVFRAALSSETSPRLDCIAASIAAVWAAAPAPRRYLELVNRVAELEAQLIDSKIAERVRGFLENRGGPDPVHAITRHVERVLRPAPTRRILEQIRHELEDEIEARSLGARAKEVLQSAYAMSEEQAHAHLRSVSRRSRKRLKDVAEELIARQVIEGRTA